MEQENNCCVQQDEGVCIGENDTHVEPRQTGKPRLAAIELCRIVCMVMVIFNHTLNQFYGAEGVGGSFATYANFINICAVGTFLIITGFFMFDGSFRYTRRLKKLFTDVLLPFAVMLVCILLYRSVSLSFGEEVGFFEVLWVETKSVCKDVLAWNLTGDYGYLWFVLAYTEIVVLYPVWYLLCKKEKPSVLARHLLLALCLASVFAENAVHLFALHFSIHVFSLININVFFVLLGYELKCLYNAGRLQGSHMCLFGFLLYAFGVILGMAFVSVDIYLRDSFSWYWYFLNTFPAVISATGMFIAFLNINIKGNHALYLFGKSGMYVYLLQSPIHVLMIHLRLNEIMYPVLNIGSYIVIGLICMVISFVLGAALSLVCGKFRKKEIIP